MKLQTSAANARETNSICAPAAGRASTIQPGIRQTVPASGTIAWTMATQSARIRAK